MALTEYTRSIATHLPNGVDVDRLTIELRTSEDISIAFSHMVVGQGGDPDRIDFYYRAPLATPEEAAFNLKLLGHSGLPLPEPKNSEGIPLVALQGEENLVQIVGRKGSEMIRVTHDFTDPTTWYSEATRVTEVLTNPSADGLTWVSSKKNWINIMSPKIHNSKRVAEEGKAAVGNNWGYLPQVRVLGVLQSARPRRASDFSLGGDYYIDYLNGAVVFKDPPSNAPEAEFFYAQGSGFTLQPAPGKVIEIEKAEVQWTTDAGFTSELVQEIQFNHPELGWIPVDQAIMKSFWEILLEARGAFPKQGPATGDPAWRGTEGVQVEHAPLVYQAVKGLKSSQGVRMCIYLAHVEYDKDGNLQVSKISADPSVAGGVGFSGGHASATFYAVSVDE